MLPLETLSLGIHLLCCEKPNHTDRPRVGASDDSSSSASLWQSTSNASHPCSHAQNVSEGAISEMDCHILATQAGATQIRDDHPAKPFLNCLLIHKVVSKIKWFFRPIWRWFVTPQQIMSKPNYNHTFSGTELDKWSQNLSSALSSFPLSHRAHLTTDMCST